MCRIRPAAREGSDLVDFFPRSRFVLLFTPSPWTKTGEDGVLCALLVDSVTVADTCMWLIRRLASFMQFEQLPGLNSYKLPKFKNL